ncbi:hypothetical protein NDU88_000241 [Pleurodeles waltl]|uniref:Uncharacterized protein n=1 Tax=Pleurodeles waltl TaxID=8319 RepID=A0AAV7S4M9_PLEWA|nr:hypothetical protein NDU88_000241 [Pleurodeles waltl]
MAFPRSLRGAAGGSSPVRHTAAGARRVVRRHLCSRLIPHAEDVRSSARSIKKEHASDLKVGAGSSPGPQLARLSPVSNTDLWEG